MADKYWVAGTGNWSDATNHWATSSGGAPGAGNKPTSADNANFDVLSGAGTVTINEAASCLDFVETGTSTITTFAGTFGLTVYGSFTLSLLSTWSHSGGITFAATSTGKTITTTGTGMSSSVTFNGVGGGWTLQDAWAQSGTTRDWTLTNGSINTNGKTVTIRTFSANNTNTKSITLGASAINITGASSERWIINSTGTTFSADTSTITFTNALGSHFTGGGFTYNNVTWNSVGTNLLIIRDTNTFNNLTLTGAAVVMGQMVFYANQTITGTLTATGNSASANRLLLNNYFDETDGQIDTVKTITAAAVSLTNVDFKGITGAGAAAPFTGTSIGNSGNNSNITFTTPVTRYWVGNGGNWTDTAHWSATTGGASGASVPIGQDTANIDANSITSASQTITMNGQRTGTVNFTGVLNTPKLFYSEGNSVQHDIHGNLTYVSGMTMQTPVSFYTTVKLTGDGSKTLATGGLALEVYHMISAPGSTYTLQDNLSMNGTVDQGFFQLSAGTFDANNKNISVERVDLDWGNTRTLLMGTGTWTLTGGSGTDVWYTNSFGSGTLTLTPSTSTIVIAVGSSQFYANGYTFNNLQITGNNDTISTDGVFNNLTLTAAKTTFITAGQTIRISTLTATGSLGNVIVFKSFTAGSPSYIICNSGANISCDYLSLKDLHASGRACWFAGANSTNVSGNTGWRFTAPTGTCDMGTFRELAVLGVGK